MRKLLCLILILSPFLSNMAQAERGPAISPIVEISAEDNSPVAPAQAVPFNFNNSREIASSSDTESSLLPLVTLVIALPIVIWLSIMMRIDRDLKKREEAFENLAQFKHKQAPTPSLVTEEEDVEEQFKKAS